MATNNKLTNQLAFDFEPVYTPTSDTMRGYKLFRLMKDGTLAPLFINKKQRLAEDIWYKSECHPTKGFATRQGWHLCLKPIAPHLSLNPKGNTPRIWVEVEFENFEMYDRPESQGGAWVLAERMKIIRRCPEITTTGWEATNA